LDELLQRTGDNMTTVVIAHRLKTVQNADLIAVLGSKDGGRIVECGSHEELLQKRNGIYRSMVERASTSGILPENV
jgi:ABC-type multidrug transport system fused ATPase/permease subunit